MSLFPNPVANLGWKIGAVGAGVLNLVIGFFLISAHIENQAIADQRDQLQSSINDPVTGYVARLTTAQNNVAVLTRTVQRQNQALMTNAEIARARLEETRAKLNAAQRESQRLKRQIDAFVAQEIEGDTLEERVRDVDERAMKEFLDEG